MTLADNKPLFPKKPEPLRKPDDKKSEAVRPGSKNDSLFGGAGYK